MGPVLCSIDLSPASEFAVAWAVLIARRMELPLVIFHAIHQPADPIHPSAEFERGGALGKQRTEVQAAIERLMQSAELTWDAEIVYGDPAEMLQQACRQRSAAMVVSGSKGFKGIKRLFMGTVVERMARMLPCPLLVIRPFNAKLPGIDAMGICCGGGETAGNLVEYASPLAAAFGAHLHLLHTMDGAMDSTLVKPTEGPYGEVQNRLKERIKAHLAGMVQHQVDVTVHLAAGQAKEKLTALIENLQPDLLVVGVRPRRTMGQWMAGSTTEAMLRRSPCHVLVVPEGFLKHKSVDDPGDDVLPPAAGTTAIIRDSTYLDHRPEGRHPENQRRLESIYAMLDRYGRDLPWRPIEPVTASFEDLTLVHTAEYVHQIRLTREKGYSQLTGDTYACEKSYSAASRSVGGVMAAIDSVLAGEVRNAFVLCRPPGHHAETSRADGFCLFNNVAIGAEYARTVKGLGKVLIVDWDLHHGNGIQHFFEDDPSVLYISTHQYPCFPGTGHHLEVGRGRGEGYTVNLPLRKRWEDGDFAYLFQNVVAPVSLAFDPDLILVSAGFDTHKKDPLGRMRLTESGFAAMTRILMDVAHACCRDRMVLVLEGGYHAKALAASVRAVLNELSDQTHTDISPLAAKAKKRRVQPVLRRTAHGLGHVWNCLNAMEFEAPAESLKRMPYE